MNLVYQGDAKPAYFTRASAITQLHETHLVTPMESRTLERPEVVDPETACLL